MSYPWLSRGVVAGEWCEIGVDSNLLRGKILINGDKVSPNFTLNLSCFKVWLSDMRAF